MNKQSREELKRLAEAATPGPWLAKESWQSSAINGHHYGKWDIRNDGCASNAFKPIGQFHGDKRLGMNGERDAKFVATANPDAIQSLLAYVDLLEAQRDRLLKALKEVVSDINGLMSESGGVYGLHLNGDNAPWGEIDVGGRFERLSGLSFADEAITEAESEQ